MIISLKERFILNTIGNINNLYDIPFDQYQRYRTVSLIVEQYRIDNKKLSILEIGANEHKNLELFLPKDEIKYLDIVVPDFLRNDSKYIIADATNMPEIEENSFDIVIALDVFEHIPNSLKENFLKELNRISRDMMVIAGPFDEEGVSDTEKRVNDYYKAKYGKDYIWLYEHIMNELPNLENTIKNIESFSNYEVLNIKHGSLYLWEKLIKCHLDLVDDESLKQNVKNIDRYYNKYCYKYDISENCYRNFLICSHKSYLTSIFDEDILKLNLNERIIEENLNSLNKIHEYKNIKSFLHEKNIVINKLIEKEKELYDNSLIINEQAKKLIEKEQLIHEKNLEIVNLINLSQSLRLKNRAKNIIKKYLPTVVVKVLKSFKNKNFIEKMKERKKLRNIILTDDVTTNNSTKYRNKIIIVSHDANLQGAPLLALYLVKHLNKFFNYDVVTILAEAGNLQSEFEKYSFVYRFDVLGEQEQVNILNNLYKNNFSLAICNTSVVGNIVEQLSLSGINTISLLHELPYVIKIANLDESINKIIKYATKIVFPSPYVEKQVSSLFQFNKNKIEICHQGRYMKNEYRFDKVNAKKRLAKKLNIDESSNIILNIGRGEFRKGFDLFIDTAIDVLKTVENVYFVWVGSCDEDIHKEGLTKIDKNLVGDKILFIDFDKEIGMYYSGSDLFYLSSREDPFPSVFIDAISSNLPVIAYENGGGFTDYMNKIDGTLIPNFDTSKMVKFICDFLTDQKFRSLYENKFINLDQDFGFNKYIFNILKIAGKTLPKVSVIVPNYNYEKYIKMRLDSIFNQTIKPYEIIFLDDNSKDNSLEIAEGLLEESGFDYKIITNKTNNGCYNQWLKGIKEAKGDIVWIAEADDLCKDNFLEKLIPKFDDENISLAYAQSVAIDENTKEMDFSYIEYTQELSKERWLNDFINKGEDEITNYLVKLNTIPNASGVLIKKSALNNIEEYITKYTSTGDWFVYIYALQHGNIAFCSTKLNFHRRHSGSIIHKVMYEPKLLKEIILISKYTYDNFQITNQDIELLVKRFNDYYSLLPNRNSTLSNDKEFEKYFIDIDFEYFWKDFIKS